MLAVYSTVKSTSLLPSRQFPNLTGHRCPPLPASGLLGPLKIWLMDDSWLSQTHTVRTDSFSQFVVQVFIVTDSSSGVGKELAQILYAHDAKVYVTARSKESLGRWLERSERSSRLRRESLSIFILISRTCLR
jgi:hypothetical protein